MGKGAQNSTKSEDIRNLPHILTVPSGGGGGLPSIEHVVGKQDAKRCLFVILKLFIIFQLHHALVPVSDPNQPQHGSLSVACALYWK